MGRKNKYKKVRPNFFKKNLASLKHNKLPKELATKPSGDYVLINQGEMDMLSRYILDYKDIETGGQLFGYWTYDGKPVVLFVLGPGPKAGHYNTFFMQDLDYLRSCARLLKQKYGLDHIGEWHSHHQLGLAHPSGHDARNISTNLRKLGYQKFLLCIGTCTNVYSSINAFMFTSTSLEYNQIPWVIKEIDSPYRRLIEAHCDTHFLLPETLVANMQHLMEYGSPKRQSINYSNTYWLTNKGNRLVLKSIIDTLQQQCQSLTVIPTVDEQNEVHIVLEQGEIVVQDIHFPMGFPNVEPILTDAVDCRVPSPHSWEYNGDIYNSFFKFFSLNFN